MSKVMLLVGTRKGCFVLESDGDRRDWDVRGPFCEGWPVYHAVYDHDEGAIYAAAASEWHGATVWRSADLGETWAQSSEGLGYAEGTDGLRCRRSRASRRRTARFLAGTEMPGSSRAATAGRLEAPATPDTTASKDWNDPGKQPPGHLGCLGDHPAPGRGRALLGDRPGLQPFRGNRRRQDVDGAQQRPPRGLAARVRRHRLLRPQVRLAPTDLAACTSRTTAASTDATTAGTPGRRSPRGCRATLALPPPCTRTTRTRFTSFPSTRGMRGQCTTAKRPSGGLATRLVLAATPPGPAAEGRLPRRATRGHDERPPRLAGLLLRHEYGSGVREHR